MKTRFENKTKNIEFVENSIFDAQKVEIRKAMTSYTGGYFRQICPKGQYLTPEGEILDGRLNVVGKIPFFPTFSEVHSDIDSAHYICDQLSDAENKLLNPCYTWNGGKSYSLKWEDTINDWVMFFFPKELIY